MTKVFPTMVLALLIASGLGAQEERNELCTWKFNPNVPGTGVEWQEWDHKTRTIFVFAYIVGHGRGSRQACEIAMDLDLSAKWSVADCVERTRMFSGTLDSYVGRITEYYQKYPEDKTIPAAFILPMLSDQAGKSPEEIHRMACSCALFMTP